MSQSRRLSTARRCLAPTASPATASGLLTLGSIGVVYGDIGTSPLYALREAVVAAVGADGAPTARRCSACCR